MCIGTTPPLNSIYFYMCELNQFMFLFETKIINTRATHVYTKKKKPKSVITNNFHLSCDSAFFLVLFFPAKFCHGEKNCDFSFSVIIPNCFIVIEEIDKFKTIPSIERRKMGLKKRKMCEKISKKSKE